MTAATTTEFVTCLGCGCLCDDITVVVRDNRISETINTCGLGQRWFGDGVVPTAARVDGTDRTREAALDVAAEILATGESVLVYLAPELSTAAAGEAIGIADRLRARLDGVASDTVAEGILAAQRRGRAGATLGEILNRGDLVVFWGVDPSDRYPRYASRYAVEPKGVSTPEGRKSRTVVAVDIGNRRGPADADTRLALGADGEVGALAVMRAVFLGQSADAFGVGAKATAELAERMRQARYVVVVNDGEPAPASGDSAATEGLIALVQALNGSTRAALSTLRAGGNRSGLEAITTWQTGFPFAVDFQRGYPRYRPEEHAGQLLAAGRIRTVLLAGAPAALPPAVAAGLGNAVVVAVGPRASQAPFSTRVAVDTAMAGIHEGGTAVRLDDVPLPLRPVLSGPPAAREVLRALDDRLKSRRNGGQR